MDADELIARWRVMHERDQLAVLSQLAAMLRSPNLLYLDKINEVFAEYDVRPDVYAQVAP